MGKVKFYVRSKTTKSNVTVYYNISISTKSRLTGKTKVTVNPDHWDGNTQLIDVSKVPSKKRANQDNLELSKFEEWINKELIDLKKNLDILSVKTELKKQVEVYYGRIKLFETRTAPTLFEYFDIFEKSLKIKGTAKSSLVTYNKLKELLLDFQYKKKTQLSYESITEEFYLEFLDYLHKPQQMIIKNSNGKPKIKRAYKKNTISTFIKHFSAIMNNSFNSGYHTNPQYKNFDKSTKKVFAVYLNEEEIQDLRSLGLSRRDAAIRDYFELLCLSGLRVNDGLDLTTDNIKDIDGVPMIVYKQMKGKKIHAFEISYAIQDIIDRWDGFPNENNDIQISVHLMNIKIKLIAKAAGIDTIIKGQPKYEWITSHTGRRSAATNAFLNGMPIWKIRLTITNHATDKQTEDYIKAENPEIIAHFVNQKNHQHEKI